MEKIKKYPAISLALTIISALIIQAVLGGNDILISGAMIQAGLCGKDDYICLLRYYSFAGLIILFLGVVIQAFLNLVKKNEIDSSPKTEIKNTKKKLSFHQKQKTATIKVSKLINAAVENSLRFSEGYSLQNEPSMKEQAILAYKAGKELMEYFKKENNRLYFSDTARKNITELYELISVCLQKMDIAMSGNFNVKLWNEYSEKLQRVKVLKDELDSEFHVLLANSDEN